MTILCIRARSIMAFILVIMCLLWKPVNIYFMHSREKKYQNLRTCCKLFDICSNAFKKESWMPPTAF